MKKKMIRAAFIVFVFISAVGLINWFFGNPGGTNVDYNNCTVYSKEDVNSAVEVIVKKMDSMDGCVLYSLKYRNSDELDYCRSLNKEKEFVECIVFDSVFRSPVRGGGAWQANAIYTWSWYLAREADGQWELLTWGYA